MNFHESEEILKLLHMKSNIPGENGNPEDGFATPGIPASPTTSETVPKTSPNRQELIQKMFDRYQEYKTLEKVAGEFGYTRERVRQYLVLGNKIGIINYKPFNRENFKSLCRQVSRDDLIELLEKYGAVRRIGEKTNISIAHLNRLFKIYDLDVSDLRKNYLKKQILKEYKELVLSLAGKHPSTYDLLSIKNGRNLWAKISRNWGTFQQFRKEQNIELSRKPRRKKIPDYEN